MKTVNVRAANLRQGDIIDGRRIKAIHKYPFRVRVKGNPHKLASTGVLIIAPNPSGNKLDVMDVRGDTILKIKRPIYNMRYRRRSSNGKQRAQ